MCLVLGLNLGIIYRERNNKGKNGFKVSGVSSAIFGDPCKILSIQLLSMLLLK